MVPVVGLTLVPAARPLFREDVCTVQFALPSLGSVELLANVALLVPLALFAALATRRPLVVLAGAVATSAAIEAVQALLPTLQRACATSDWAMNSAGGSSASCWPWPFWRCPAAGPTSPSRSPGAEPADPGGAPAHTRTSATRAMDSRVM